MPLVIFTCHVKSPKTIPVMAHIYLSWKTSNMLLGIVKIVALNFTPNMD